MKGPDWFLDRASHTGTLLAVVLPLFSIAVSQTFLALAFVAFSAERLQRARPRVVWPPITVPFSLFVVTTFFSYLASPQPEIGTPPLRKLVLFVIVVLVVNKFSKERVLQAYHWMFVAGALAAGFSIYQYFFSGRGVVSARLTGFMGHWMTLSGELMLVCVAAAGYLAFVRPRRRLFIIGVLCLIGVALLLTLSRSAWLSVLIGLVAILRMRRSPWSIFAVAGLALTLLILMGPRVLQTRVQSIVDPKDPSNYARLAIWRAGWLMLKAHPWFGVGPERVSRVFYDYHPHPEDRRRAGFFPVHLHNNLLQFAGERGLPCALAWFWLMLKMGADHRKQFWTHSEDPEAAAICAIGFLSVLVLFLAGLFEFNFGDSEVLMIFLFMATAPYAQGSCEKIGRASPPASRRLRRFLSHEARLNPRPANPNRFLNFFTASGSS